ncbi:MAG: hypothetical protein GTN76_11010 [Candidatus Aenigmarchaeota archaeon]|nr:hypothetical protein [Candidatus Aenigmarchaeota archaeon]
MDPNHARLSRCFTHRADSHIFDETLNVGVVNKLRVEWEAGETKTKDEGPWVNRVIIRDLTDNSKVILDLKKTGKWNNPSGDWSLDFEIPVQPAKMAGHVCKALALLTAKVEIASFVESPLFCFVE